MTATPSLEIKGFSTFSPERNHMPRVPQRTSELWQRIRAVRDFKKWTQDQLAEQLGRSRAAVALWESHSEKNRTEPSPSTLRKIAEVTGVPLEFLHDDSAHPDDVWQLHARTSDAAKVIRPTEQGWTSGPMPPAPAVPIAAAPDSLDRKSRAFWSAVEFNVTDAAPETSRYFFHNMDVSGVAVNIDFCSPDHFAQFIAVNENFTASLAAAIGNLYLARHLYPAQPALHILVYAPAGAPHTIDPAQVLEKFNVHLLFCDKVVQASRYISSLVQQH